jgi:hypothetical protein
MVVVKRKENQGSAGGDPVWNKHEQIPAIESPAFNSLNAKLHEN